MSKTSQAVLPLTTIAWRNLWRNRTRTLILLSAIGGSYALALMTMAMGDDMHGKMAQRAGEAAGGHVLVQAQGYLADREAGQVVSAPEGVLSALRALPGVDDVAPRVNISGLLTTSEDSAPVVLQGVDSARERLLGDPGSKLTKGAMPKPDEGGRLGHPIVLGVGLAEELGVTLEDRVVLTATRADGEVTRALFLVSGLLKTGNTDLDRSFAYTNLKGARSAIGLGADEVHQIGVVAPQADSLALVGAVEAALASQAPAAGGTDKAAGQPKRIVIPWQRAMPELVGFIEIDDAFNYLILCVLFIIVAFAIANSFLMVVMERVREFGLLSALGLTSRRIALVLLLETGLLTTVSLLVGFSLGLSGHLALDHYGLDIAALYGVQLDMAGIDMSDLILRSELRPLKWATATALVGGLVMVSAVYPAWRASRMAPAEAMRFYD